MAILILKHNALTPYADLQGAKAGIIEKMASAQQGEIWAAEYFTPSSEGVEEIKGVILAFKGKNGIVTFTDSSVMSDEIKTALSEYYTKEEIDGLLDEKIGKDDVMLENAKTLTSKNVTLSKESPTFTLTGEKFKCQLIDIRGESDFAQFEIETTNGVIWNNIGRKATSFYLELDNSSDPHNAVVVYWDSEDVEAVTEYINVTNAFGMSPVTVRLVSDTVVDLDVEILENKNLNTKESFEHLNESKADKTEVESSLALKADKAEVEETFTNYYNKAEVDELVENVTNNAIGIAEGDGIAVEGEGTIKTISANLDLNIVTVEGKEMLQIVDGSDNSKILAEVDASAFVVDGMLSSAEIVTVDDETELPEGVELSNGKYIKLSWNTDSGKSDTYISVANLISEHQVNAGGDVPGEFVVVTTNVVESTDENGVKVSTVNVTVDDTAVKSALDSKIGKDDVMLEGGELLSSWEGNNVSETPYMTNNWSAQIEELYNYNPTTIYNENDEVIFELPSSEELDAPSFPILNYIYTHNNGELSITVELMDAPENYTTNIQINPTSAYRLVFGKDATSVKLTGDIYTELPTNTKKSFQRLNKSIVEFDSEIRELYENKADKTEVEAKIGKEDGMIMVSSEPTTNTTTYSGREYFTTSLFNGTNWTVECTLNHDNDFINLVLLEQNDVVIKEIGYFSKKLILTNDNGTVTINKDEQISTITIDPSKSYKLVVNDNLMDPSSHLDVTITKGGGDTTLNTQESLNYLNENKADKVEVETSISDVNIALDNKLGKFDTVLSVNDGETNTEYNVEGALEYLKSEIEAMNVIDCGQY